MKKIVKLIFVFFICLVPMIGMAKTTVSYEWKLDSNCIIGNKGGNYYFLSFEDYSFNAYSKEGDFVSKKDFSRMFYDYSFNELVNDSVLNKMTALNGHQMFYNSKYDEYYSVDYEEKAYSIYDKARQDIDFFTNYSFDDDIENTRDFLGLEFDVYEMEVEDGVNVTNLYYESGYYIVYGNDYNGKYIGRVYDSSLKLIFERVEEESVYGFLLHIDNDKIYLVSENTKLEIYDMTGRLLDSFILFDHISDDLEEYEGYEFSFFNFDIMNNNLVISYALYAMNPASDMVTGYDNLSEVGKGGLSELLSFKFRLKYEIEEVPVENGKVNLENKIDENDREYVELDIVPNERYVVGNISVKDTSGKMIEVTNNKFYMPNSDVTLEVQFREAEEYVPVPDTFLSKSLTLIFIGFVLIGFGAYTINYVKE